MSKILWTWLGYLPVHIVAWPVFVVALVAATWAIAVSDFFAGRAGRRTILEVMRTVFPERKGENG